MSEPEHEPTHRPVPESDLQPLVYALSAQFHPPIKLDRTKGMEFAPKLSSAIDARDVTFEESKWTFSQPMGSIAAGRFSVNVSDTQIAIEASFPSDNEEVFENRSRVIFSEFHKFFRPDLLLSSGALVRATLQIDGDAREFLARYVTKFDKAKLRAMGRPIHLFGIRLFMPPFVLEKQTTQKPTPKGKPRKRPTKTVETTDWMVDVKAESLLDDTSKLFLEADSRWEAPEAWEAKATGRIVDRLGTVSGFLRNNFIRFLTNETESKGD